MIRTFTSDTPKADTAKHTAVDSLGIRAREAMRDSVVYQPRDSVVATRAGTNRFVWNLRYAGAEHLANTVIDEGTLDGPVVTPGDYTARLIVDKDTLTRKFSVAVDPRATATNAEVAQQVALALTVRGR